ncbi:HI1409 family phage-associated protein [Pandoraea communis]|uniref:HI1409 family phage-associated protein n=1 Tax=Pandoraea communis TaxID=2508297 RepID=A0A5E4TY10_9BURK|nr:DUF1073 domain-containing protein [Pandoraea communis]VVD90759.1 HI1409 family phage-associated protein [Pandoraea communis]
MVTTTNKVAAVPTTPEKKKGLNIRPDAAQNLLALAKMHMSADGSITTPEDSARAKFEPYQPAPGVVPQGVMDRHPNRKGGQAQIAMDGVCNGMAHVLGNFRNSQTVNGSEFVGYGVLALLEQHPLIRAPIEARADEMAREFVELFSTEQEALEDDPDRKDEIKDRIRQIQEEMDRLHVKKRFRDAEAKTGYAGGCMLYIDMGNDPDDEAELKTPLVMDKAKLQKDGKPRIKALKLIEPINVYPAPYNADNPLKDNFYRPESWYVMGRETHSTRLLHFADNIPPVLLKPAYNFFGIPLAQMMIDYVDKFDTARVAAADLVDKFSQNIIKTDMTQILSGGGAEYGRDLAYRAMMFSQQKHNRSLLTIDMEKEEFVQVNTPLSGVSDIVFQAMQFLAGVARTPVTKYFGLSPTGLSATGEFDMRNWYDFCAGKQASNWADNLAKVLDIIMIGLWGEVDSAIKSRFLSLYKPDPEQTARVNKLNAETGDILIANQTISREEERQRVGSDPSSGYDALDTDTLPDAVPTDDDDPDATGTGGEEEDDDLPNGGAK